MSRSRQQRLMQLPAVCEYMGIKKKFFDTKIRSLVATDEEMDAFRKSTVK